MFGMPDWQVEFHDRFEPEFDAWPEIVREEALALAGLLARFGPSLGRPHADTLAGSRHANMKELRFTAANGAWRIAFAFDPARRAILLVGGCKSGVSEKRFYRTLLRQAEERYAEHLAKPGSARRSR